VILPGVVVVTLATVVLQRGVADKDPSVPGGKQGLPKR